jgi:DNA-binding LacI/PurR family transcriptional regulator
VFFYIALIFSRGGVKDVQMKLTDIARLAGVSKATASRALADSPLVREETRLRVQKIAKEHGYVPNALAQAVATKRSGIIGMCIYRKQLPYFAHTFFGPLLDGAIVEAKEHGYHIVVTSTNQDFDTFDEHFIQDSVDGVILTSFTPLEAVAEFRRRRIPLVLVNDVLETKNNAFIIQDDYGGATAMMDHLFERGHQKIAYLSGRLSHVSYHLRYLAYLHAHHRRGVPVYNNPDLPAPDLWEGFPRLDNDVSKLRLFGLEPHAVEGTPLIVKSTATEAGANAVRELLKTKDLPTAIFASSDSLAIGALRALNEAGVKVPGDIALGGFDDIELAKGVWPPLTTVKAGPFEMGRIAIRELLLQIENPTLDSRVRKVPTSLVVREST